MCANVAMAFSVFPASKLKRALSGSHCVTQKVPLGLHLLPIFFKNVIPRAAYLQSRSRRRPPSARWTRRGATSSRERVPPPMPGGPRTRSRVPRIPDAHKHISGNVSAQNSGQRFNSGIQLKTSSDKEEKKKRLSTATSGIQMPPDFSGRNSECSVTLKRDRTLIASQMCRRVSAQAFRRKPSKLTTEGLLRGRSPRGPAGPGASRTPGQRH